jgi:hypothetical protein
VENPRTGQQVGVTGFFCGSEQVASVIIAGIYNEVPTNANCLTPGRVGTVTVIEGGSINALGMTFTINLSAWTIYDAHRWRSGCIQKVSSYNVPLRLE